MLDGGLMKAVLLGARAVGAPRLLYVRSLIGFCRLSRLARSSHSQAREELLTLFRIRRLSALWLRYKGQKVRFGTSFRIRALKRDEVKSQWAPKSIAF
jgi:hypothetical protein